MSIARKKTSEVLRILNNPFQCKNYKFFLNPRFRVRFPSVSNLSLDVQVFSCLTGFLPIKQLFCGTLGTESVLVVPTPYRPYASLMSPMKTAWPVDLLSQPIFVLDHQAVMTVRIVARRLGP